jgi:hypothetical protein
MMRTSERRKHQRYHVSVKAHWASPSGEDSGYVTNIGLNGCYIESNHQAQSQETIEVEIRLPDSRKLVLPGTVTYTLPPMGFGVSFGYLSRDEEKAIMDIVADAEE